MNVHLIKDFCKPFVCGCKDFVRGKEGERLLKRSKMGNHSWKEEILFVFVVVTEEEHWMLREREEEEKDITEDLA
jgi:hypothetical protein